MNADICIIFLICVNPRSSAVNFLYPILSYSSSSAVTMSINRPLRLINADIRRYFNIFLICVNPRSSAVNFLYP
ncbi:MAG: hypothetical protein AAB116_21275, partial [Candidatus Poribacteria bacterium]